MLAASLVGLAALSLSVSAAGLNGTTLTAGITASTERVRDHQWTVAKTASVSGLDLFRGSSASVAYTIAATKTGIVERAFVKGLITVTNGGEDPTADLSIVAEISTVGQGAGTVATGPVSVAAKGILAPGETFAYPYSVEVPNAVVGQTYKATARITIMNHSGSLGSLEGPSPSETTVMTGAIGDVNAAVDVDDSNGSSFPFSASGTTTYSRSFTCDTDAGVHVNTATLRQTGASAQATVTVRCFALSITTDATTSLTRTYTWSITKTADETSITLEPDGSSATVGYVVGLTSTAADSAWAVAGLITVTNAAPIDAPLASVTAALPAGPANVTSCPGAVPAGSSVTCSYDRALGSAASTTVTATATMTNQPSGATSYSASANVDFASARVTHVDQTVTVTDSANGAAARTLGTVTAGETGRFAYTQRIGSYDRCGAYTFPNAASFTGSNGATGSASASVAVRVKCYELGVTGTSATKLTRTFSWTIDKGVNATTLALEPGRSGELRYTVDLAARSADSGWAAAGTITVTNPAPVAASLSSLAASALGTGVTVSGCPTSVPARGSIECAWTAALASGANGTLGVVAALSDSAAFTASSYSGSATVDFGGADVTKVDETVQVKDAFGTGAPRDLGSVTATAGGHFEYAQAVGPYAKCGAYTLTNTATFLAPSGRSGTDGASATANVKCYDLGASSTAATSFTRTHTWGLTKTASAASLSLPSGATGSLAYTVTLTPSATDSGWTARGTVAVTNPAPVPTSLSGVTATIGATAVPVACASLALPAGGSTECTWTATLGSGGLATFTATATLADSDAFNSATASATAVVSFAGTSPTEVDRTATVTDVMGGTERTLGPATAGAPTTYTYSMPVGPFSGCAPTSVTNRATLTTGDTRATRLASVTTPVTVVCSTLGVSADARTEMTRTYAWRITKTAGQSAVTLATGQSANVDYTVGLTSTSADSAWTARGTITLTNPAAVALTLTSVSASAAGSGAAVDCPTMTIAANGTITCTWSRSLSGAASGTVTVTATLPAGAPFDSATYSASAPFTFDGAAVTEVDRSVTVTDSAGGTTRTLGTVNAGEAGVFSYAMAVGPYATCGQYSFANTATYRAATTGATGSASATVGVTVTCVAPPVSTTDCTYTIGYWKTHGSEIARYLTPAIALGNTLVTSSSQAVNILKKSDSSNGIEKLQAQLLAAKLSIARGADPSAVSGTIATADAQLRTYGTSRWNSLSKTIQSAILGTATTLDRYNNGVIGPGHCG